MPRNRYTTSQRISEPDFIEILMGVVIGCSTSRINELANVKKTTIASYTNKIIHRIMSDTEVSGWMNGGHDLAQPDDDEFWHTLHNCLVNCPNEQYSTAPCTAPHVDHTDILARTEIKKERGAKRLAGLRQRKACGNCTIASGGIFNDLITSLFFHYYLHEVSIRKPKTGADYRRAFFLASLRCNLFTANDRFAEHSLLSFVQSVLRSCEENRI